MPTEAEQLLAEAEVTLEFEDLREEQLIREAVQGRDTHEWLHTSVGRFVTGAAAQDIRDIEQKLAVTPVWRKRKIQALQNERRSIILALTWLTDAVRVGMLAEQTLEAERVTE